ncbi:NUDIX domain-containing protein [Pseudokineococcus basanitobsidens]|uniref:NUDIX domain-containing protein n=1 Tax=Pseudokineococcus basanitobsidens TaxID=1926649 RepID=A0ABU8RHG5_9ACTN
MSTGERAGGAGAGAGRAGGEEAEEAGARRVDDAEVVPAAGGSGAPEVPVRRQRVAAYVLCRRGDAVLLSRLSPGTPRPGLWSLPGGGLDHGEDPRAGARREAHEETGLDVVVGEVLDVGSTHFTGRAPGGPLEDYHGVSVVFRGACDDEREPRVVEVGGTSDAAAWVPLREVESGVVGVTDVVRLALAAG